MIDQLDDPHLLNRQFAQTSIESLTGMKMDQVFGYWYYMTLEERRADIPDIFNHLLTQKLDAEHLSKSAVLKCLVRHGRAA